jgi:ABC-type transport system substrate-binding protein
VARVALAEPIQEMLRQVGVQIELVRLDGPVWFERRERGEFDIDFSQANLDPSPSGLVQSWSCAGIGGSNVGQTCNPAFDAALSAATLAGGRPEAAWVAALTELQRTTPAVFLYSPTSAVVLQTRYQNVSFRPEAPWADLWRWSVSGGRQTARDLQAAQ